MQSVLIMLLCLFTYASSDSASDGTTDCTCDNSGELSKLYNIFTDVYACTGCMATSAAR